MAEPAEPPGRSRALLVTTLVLAYLALVSAALLITHPVLARHSLWRLGTEVLIIAALLTGLATAAATWLGRQFRAVRGELQAIRSQLLALEDHVAEPPTAPIIRVVNPSRVYSSASRVIAAIPPPPATPGLQDIDPETVKLMRDLDTELRSNDGPE